MILEKEIRINSNYAHLYSSEYEGHNKKATSTPIIDEKIIDTLTYQNSIKNLFNRDGVINILPDKCKYVEKVGDHKIFIIEEQPAVRTLKLDLYDSAEYNYLKHNHLDKEYDISSYFNSDGHWIKSKRGGHKIFNLSFPYIVFIIVLDNKSKYCSAEVYFRLTPLRGLGDYLLKAPLFNIDSSQGICLGSYSARNNYSDNAVIKNVLDTFWNAIYNNDFTCNYKEYQTNHISGVSTYTEWDILTKQNPSFIFDVEWIRMSCNIKDRIDKLKSYFSNTNYNYNTDFFETLKRLFRKSTSKNEVVGEKFGDSTINKLLHYDIMNGLMPKDTKQLPLHVGDPFYVQHKKAFCYIRSFVGYLDNMQIKYLQVERNDGRILKFKFTKAFQKFLYKQTKDIRTIEEAQLKNGTIIKANDIIEIKVGNQESVYKQIDYLRRTPYNNGEARFKKGGFYILENLDAKLLDFNEGIDFSGIKIIKDKWYIVIETISRYNNTILNLKKLKLDRINLGGFNTLSIKMFNEDYNINLQQNIHTVYNINDLEKIPNRIFRHGNELKLLSNFDWYEKEIPEIYFYKTKEGIIIDDDMFDRGVVNNVKDLYNELIKDDVLYIHGFDLDIKFSIGDQVVVADWTQPESMFIYKKIIKFNADNEKLDFVLEDVDGNITEHTYIFHRNKLNIGSVRHITSNYENLEAGDIIKANNVGIANFPKKDNNIIIGFLTDSGLEQPLVLCSNGCTLYYQEVIDYFNIIKSDDRRYKRLIIAPIELHKIKVQPGDLISYGENPNIRRLCVYNENYHRIPFDNVSRVEYNSIIGLSFNFCTFLSPRLKQKDIYETVKSILIPNFHGGYKKLNLKERIGWNIPKIERSIINV